MRRWQKSQSWQMLVLSTRYSRVIIITNGWCQDPRLGFDRGWSLIGQRVQGSDSLPPCKMPCSFLHYRFTGFGNKLSVWKCIFTQNTQKSVYFFPFVHREQKKPSKQIGEGYQSGSTKGWGPCSRGGPRPEAEPGQDTSRTGWDVPGALREHCEGAHSLLHWEYQQRCQAVPAEIMFAF